MTGRQTSSTGFSLRRKAALLSAVVSAMVATPLLAQEPATSSNNEEAQEQAANSGIIIVSARKRDENIQDIPLAIAVVGGDVLDQNGISDLRDLASLIPSVTFDRGISQGDFRPAIRGLQAETGRTSVGILIDGVDVTSEALQTSGGGFLANQRLLDVDRIEVVKGPQSALYGRSAFGGAINYITRRPDLNDPEHRASAEVTTEDSYELRGAIGVPLVADVAALRVNGYLWNDRGNHINQISGDYVGGGDGYGVSASVLVEPSPNLSVYGSASYSKDKYDPCAVFISPGNTTVQFSPDQQTVTGQTSRVIYTGEVEPGQVFLDLDPRTGEDYPGAENPKWRFSLISELNFGDLKITSLSSYNNVKFSAREDGDVTGTPIGEPVLGAFLQTIRANTTEQFSQELRIQSDSDSRFQWLVGGLYWTEKVEQTDFGVNGTAFGPLTREDYNAFFIGREDAITPRILTRDTEHLSAFAFAEYALTDRLAISFEARYSSETIDYFADQSPGSDAGFTFFYGVIPTDVSGEPSLLPLATIDGLSTDRIKEEFFLPRAAISFEASDNLNFYASVGKGVKPAGNATGSVIVFDDSVSYDRETLWAYEVGMKSQWFDNRLLFNTSFFYQDYTDQQVTSQIFNEELQVLRGVIENAGNSVIWGIEADTRLSVNENITLSVVYTYLNAEFKDFSVLSTSASRIAEGNCTLVTFEGGAPPACLIDRSGNRPADLPKHRLIGQFNFVEQLNDTWDIFANGSVSYNSSEFAETSNVIVQSAETIIDLDVGIDNGPVRIAAFVRNLADSDVITDANLGVDYRNGFLSTANGFLADPRTWGLRINVVY